MSPDLVLAIDPIAMFRGQREGIQPDPVHFALEAERWGFTGIKAHLRMDRRHLSERDIELLLAVVKTRLYLQISPHVDLDHHLNQWRPSYAILVNERREEKSTETGLDAMLLFKNLSHSIKSIDQHVTKLFLAIDPLPEQIRSAAKLGVYGVCLNIRDIMLKAHRFEKGLEEEHQRLQDSLKLAKKFGMETHLFNAVTPQRLKALGPLTHIDAIHLGYAFLSECLFHGLGHSMQQTMASLQQWSSGAPT
jgi:pyridoxine 5-phosphate synthase